MGPRDAETVDVYWIYHIKDAVINIPVS
jgi:hypothetical protein